MKLKEMLVGLEGLKVKGDLELEIKELESNSKKVKKDYQCSSLRHKGHHRWS